MEIIIKKNKLWIPSDVLGIIYEYFDMFEAYRIKIAREIHFNIMSGVILEYKLIYMYKKGNLKSIAEDFKHVVRYNNYKGYSSYMNL